MKILIWYIDVNGMTRIEILEKPYYITMQQFLQDFQDKSTVKTVLEAFTISATHKVLGTGDKIEEVITT